MLLTAHEMGIGSCRIGNLMKKADDINELLQLDSQLELMGVVSFEYGRGKPMNIARKARKEFLI